MSKVFSPKQIDALHYIPCNHVLASYMVGGRVGATAHAKKEAEHMSARFRYDGYSDEAVLAFASWYQGSCDHVIRQLESGQAIQSNYAPFKPPAEKTAAAST